MKNKYYLVSYSVRDGEYEYHYSRGVRGTTMKQAEKNALVDPLDWTRDDHREVVTEGIQEIPKEHYQILKKYYM